MVINALVFFLQEEDGIRYRVRSRGLGDVYKRQALTCASLRPGARLATMWSQRNRRSSRPCHVGRIACRAVMGTKKAGDSLATMPVNPGGAMPTTCPLYTSDAADGRSSGDLGGRRIIKKKNNFHLAARSILIKEEGVRVVRTNDLSAD